MIRLHRSNRSIGHNPWKGRPFWRRQGRWKIERLFSRLDTLHHLVVRWEDHIRNDLGLLHPACAGILLMF